MNIFFTDKCPIQAANNLSDIHIVAMIRETAQMLSTAHRTLDGENINGVSIVRRNYNDTSSEYIKKKSIKILTSFDERVQIKNSKKLVSLNIYMTTHINHPSTIWARTNNAAYKWLLTHWEEMNRIYTTKTGNVHGSLILRPYLSNVPININQDDNLPVMPMCMPDEYKQNCPIEAYKSFYISKQDKMKMKWSNNRMPEWYRLK